MSSAKKTYKHDRKKHQDRDWVSSKINGRPKRRVFFSASERQENRKMLRSHREEDDDSMCC